MLIWFPLELQSAFDHIHMLIGTTEVLNIDHIHMLICAIEVLNIIIIKGWITLSTV